MVGEFVGFWVEKFNLGFPKCSPLEMIGFTPTAIFKFATNISRMIRIARNTGVALKAPTLLLLRACTRAGAAENSMLHVE